MLTDKDILFASLMGTANIKTYQRTQLVQNELSKHVLPRIPFLPFQNENVIAQENLNPSWLINQTDLPIPEEQQFFSLSFSLTENGQRWLFPYEPMITISSGNTVIKRNVAKQGDKLIGTIKERWNRKDFDITVTGVLMGSLTTGKFEDCFPRAQMRKLFEFLKYNKEFYIYCAPLEILGIIKVVVEDYTFPFTKGENVQAYDLKLTSDDFYNLLVIEENK
ncbi:DUF6046 domain-containing protein [Flavobacterium sp. LS2P90]|uniref:DUF6046 domain-containing protein n=1 Tax=Flavobacterium xylosi TaxID=3230415 RepID=A0ABW6HYQ7_9FLAO